MTPANPFDSFNSAQTVEQRAIRELEREISRERGERRSRRIGAVLKYSAAGLVGYVIVRYFSGMGLEILLLFGGGAALAEAVIHSRRELAITVSELSTPGAVGALALAYHSEDTLVRRAAVTGLKRLLPQVSAEHRDDLSADGHRALISLLGVRETQLVLGALHALGEIGGQSALPAVERLARGGIEAVWWRHAHIHGPVPLGKIRRRAEQSLDLIRQRVEEERERACLLRPVEQAPSDLLRPAMTPPSGDPASLLRSASTDL